MTRHISAENLARFRDGDLRPAAARRVPAHLEGCARCRETSAALAGLPDLLAAAEVPPIPAHLAARIETALATESAHRAAGSPSMRASSPGPSGHAERARRRAPLPFPARRILAAAAVIVVIAGGYELVSHLAGPEGSSAASSAAGASNHAAAGRAPAAGPLVPGVVGAPVYGPPMRYRHAGRTATIRPVRTTTNYQPARLAQQVSATLAETGAAATARPGSQPGTVPQQNLPDFGAAQLTQLAGCVSRVAGGRLVLLVDVARFGGAPATVIVTAAQAPLAAQAWAVGPGCSRSASDVLAHQPLPGR
jgi:Putative zinc-finger